MFLKISLLFLTLITMVFSKQENVTLDDGMFSGNVYSGNIENGKLNGQGLLYCKDKPKQVFLNGTFVNGEFSNGKLDSCKDFSDKDEIKFGNLTETKY